MTDTRRPVPSQQMRPSPPPPPSPSTPEGERWIDLREAAELTGIPASTIRNWARKQRIDSRFEMDESGDRRYVEITEVVAWADHLGRQHKRVAGREALVASDEEEEEEEEVASREAPVASEEEVTSREADIADDNAIRSSQFADLAEPTVSETPEEPGRAEDEVASRESRVASGDTRDVPEGTMLVPLDAWNKMLNQLGNLHEAGQQLAEARERAAKAETEVQFLRERLSELREQPRAITPEPDPPPPPEDPVDPLWVDLYRRWKRRRH